MISYSIIWIKAINTSNNLYGGISVKNTLDMAENGRL